MSNWKQSLDRYLTREPDSRFDNWADEIVESLSDEFYYGNMEWVDENNGQFVKWLNALWGGYTPTPKESAKIIERAFNLYRLTD